MTTNHISRLPASSSGPVATPRRALFSAHRAPASKGNSITIAARDESRNGDVIRLSGGRFESYMRNPVVLWSHDDHALPIGRTTKLRHEGSKLRADFEFLPDDPMAERVRNAWKLGFVNAASIRYFPIKVERDGTVSEWDLLEWSLLPIPADPDALRAAARALGVPEETLRRDGVLTRQERSALAEAQTELNKLLDYLRKEARHG